MKSDPASTSSVASAPDKTAIRSITRRYWAMWAFYSFGPSFIFAIYPLFLRSRGLDQFHINLVAAWYLVVIFLTDVPTGAFADVVGRRTSLVIGCAFHVAGLYLYFVSHHYWHFILAETLEGFGDTFGNGPIDAWAVDSLDAAGFSGAKDAIFSRQFQIVRLVGMSGGLIGAYVAQRNIATPFLLSTFAWAAAGAAALFLMNRNPPRRGPLSRAQIVRDIRRKTIDSTQLGFTHRGVRLMSLAALITASVWSGWWLEWQHYFNHGFGAGISVIGWIFVAISLAQLAGAEIAARASWIWKRRAAFVAAMSATASAALIVSGLAAGGGRVWIALAAVLLAHLTSGTIGPMIAAWFNELIGGENRATLLSFQGSAITFGAAIGQPVQGRMVDVLGVSLTWQLAGIVSMAQALCYLALGRPLSDATDGAGVPGVD